MEKIKDFDQELKENVLEVLKGTSKDKPYIGYYKLLKEIGKRLGFDGVKVLDKDEPWEIMEKVFRYEKRGRVWVFWLDLSQRPICYECGKEIPGWKVVKYGGFCSKKCALLYSNR